MQRASAATAAMAKVFASVLRFIRNLLLALLISFAGSNPAHHE
jgi:hypothetical protein